MGGEEFGVALGDTRRGVTLPALGAAGMAADTLGKVLNPGHQKANPSKDRRLELRAGVLGNQPLFPLQAQGEPTSPPVLPRGNTLLLGHFAAS